MPLTKRRPTLPISPSLPFLPLGPVSESPIQSTAGCLHRENGSVNLTRAGQCRVKEERLHAHWERSVQWNLPGTDELTLDAAVDTIVRAEYTSTDRDRPALSANSRASASTSNLARTTTISDRAYASTAHLLHSSSTGTGPLRDAPCLRFVPPVSLPPASSLPPPRRNKLRKRRVSGTAAAAYKDSSPSCLPDPPQSPQAVPAWPPIPVTASSSVAHVPEGAGAPVLQYVLTSSLSRHASGSTTTSSLRRVSVETAVISTPPEPATKHNRGTFGPVSEPEVDEWRSLFETDTAAGDHHSVAAIPADTAISGHREPSLYDFTEILHSTASFSRASGALVNPHLCARFRSCSLGGPSSSESTFSIGDIVRSGPLEVAEKVHLAIRVEKVDAKTLPAVGGGTTTSTQDPIGNHRRAPPPPHLLTAPRSSTLPPSSHDLSRMNASSGDAKPAAPAIPARSTSLDSLWRRMSGKKVLMDAGNWSRPRDNDSSGSGNIAELGRRPNLLRALSSRSRPHKADQRDVPDLPVPPTESRVISIDEDAGVVDAIAALATVSQTGGPSSLNDKQRNSPKTPPRAVPRRASSLPAQTQRHKLKPVPPLKVILNSSIAAIAETAYSHPPGPPCDNPVRERVAERKRQFRRTLVEVDNDFEFQALLQDSDGSTYLHQSSVPLSPGACCGDDGLQRSLDGDEENEGLRDPFPGEPLPLSVTTERRMIQAWFVMRELIQGEKRHGRLLARGVAIARSIAERAGLLAHGLPELAQQSVSYSPRPSPTKRRSRLSRPYTHIGYRKTDASRPLSGISTLTLPLSMKGSTSMIHLEAIEDVSPLDILLHRLPRLLALSLTLTSRFAHDPSPDQVATAFLSMETDLLFELGEWAGEVGPMMAMGLGDSLDEELRADAEIRRSSTSDLEALGLLVGPTGDAGSALASTRGSEEKEDDRMSFSEVLLGPVQRAARYRLLFNSLAGKMPPGPGKDQVQAALYAAERLVDGVNRRQDCDLEDLRRRNVSMSTSAAKVRRDLQSMRQAEPDGDGELVLRRRKASGVGRRVKGMYASA